MDDKQIDQALHAAEQNMTDVLTLWQNGRTSNLVLGEALKDMKNDGLKLVKRLRADRAAALTPAPAQTPPPAAPRCGSGGVGEWPEPLPVSQLSNKLHCEYLYCLFPDGSVHLALYEQELDEPGAWGSYSEDGFEPLSTQPTHFWLPPAPPSCPGRCRTCRTGDAAEAGEAKEGGSHE